MIFGIGIDIIEIDRIAASYASFGERFARFYRLGLPPRRQWRKRSGSACDHRCAGTRSRS